MARTKPKKMPAKQVKKTIKENLAPPAGGSTVKVLSGDPDHKIAGQRDYLSEYYRSRKEDYPFQEIRTAESVDSYMKRAINRKLAVISAAGMKVRGSKESFVKYIEQRFAELSVAQSCPLEILFLETLRDFIRHNNAMLVKKRDSEGTQIGKSRRAYASSRKRKLDPIAAYYRLDIERTAPWLDKDGRHIGWRYVTKSGQIEEYYLHDVVHFYIDKKPGEYYAQPSYIPVLDDIRALRRLEEGIELLVHQYLFPLLIVTVGDKDTGGPKTFPDGTTEIQEVVKQLNSVVSEGGWVVPFRWKVDTVDIKNNLPIQEYIKHFKERVFIGLGVSQLDMGIADTANRSTGDVLSTMIEDDIRLYLNYFQLIVNHEIINELMLESGGAVDIFDRGKMPYFEFNDININQKIKRENHALVQFQGNALTHSELRHALKRNPVTKAEEAELNSNMFLAQETNKAAENSNTPANQHGKKTAPTGRKSSIDKESIEDMYQIHTKVHNVELKRELTRNSLQLMNLALDNDENNSYIEVILDSLGDLTSEVTEIEFQQHIENILNTLILRSVE